MMHYSDHTSFGCDGGLPSLAYQYVQNTGGLERERKYPYTSMDGNSGSCEVGSEKRRNYAVSNTLFYAFIAGLNWKEKLRASFVMLLQQYLSGLLLEQFLRLGCDCCSVILARALSV